MASLSFATRLLGFVVLAVLVNVLAAVALTDLGISGFAILGVGTGDAIAILIAASGLVAVSLYLAFPRSNVGSVAASLSILLFLILAAWGLGFISSGVALVATSMLGLIGDFVFLLWFLFRVHRLPLSFMGMGELKSVPAVPIRLSELPGTALKLYKRSQQIEPAKQGFSTIFTLGEGTSKEKKASGYTFMYGAGESRSLDLPEQFAMGWTTFGGIAQRAAPLLPLWASALTDPVTATEQFWPTIAKYNLPFNLLPLERVSAARAGQFRKELGAHWTSQMEGLLNAGNLYVIDMTIFKTVTPPDAEFPRFTPWTLTFLEFNSIKKTFTPFLIRVCNAETTQYFTNTPATGSTWLYALQAAKTGITVWGIWMGHVYHFHIVTAAMQMTMFQHLAPLHPVRQIFGRQSDYLIGFDEFLLLEWTISPPTSIDISEELIRLMNTYSMGRAFFDDDPHNTLDRLGLKADDFTTLPVGDPARVEWDRYPVVHYLLKLWDATSTYVSATVEAMYPSDHSVAHDASLQLWIKTSGEPNQGNVRGLPAMNTRAALTSVLTSLVYRVTAHGSSRMEPVANPALTFISNFPPCLEISRTPDPNSMLTTRELLAFLPKTGSMGAMAAFLFTFIYSPPYIPFIPIAGIEADLSYRGPAKAACDKALIQYRREVQAFIEFFAADSNFQNLPANMNFQVGPAQIHQWELNIET